MSKDDLSQAIRMSWHKDDPTSWFEDVYAKAANGGSVIPWTTMGPHPDLVEWLEDNTIDGTWKKAVVIGAGLGDDAEALSECGFDVTAFDISETAVEWCKRRFPESTVNYQVADLLNLPD